MSIIPLIIVFKNDILFAAVTDKREGEEAEEEWVVQWLRLPTLTITSCLTSTRQSDLFRSDPFQTNQFLSPQWQIKSQYKFFKHKKTIIFCLNFSLKSFTLSYLYPS